MARKEWPKVLGIAMFCELWVRQPGLQQATDPYSEQENFIARQSELSFGQDEFVVGKSRVLRVSQRGNSCQSRPPAHLWHPGVGGLHGRDFCLPAPMRCVNQGGSDTGYEDAVCRQFPSRRLAKACEAGRAVVAPDVANLTQQRGQPGEGKEGRPAKG